MYCIEISAEISTEFYEDSREPRKGVGGCTFRKHELIVKENLSGMVILMYFLLCITALKFYFSFSFKLFISCKKILQWAKILLQLQVVEFINNYKVKYYKI